MESIIRRLQEIKAQVEVLKQEQNEALAALTQKDREIGRLKKLIEIQNSSLKDMEHKLKMKRLAEEASGSEDDENGSNRDLKFKINEMIKEVDKIITIMHQ